MAQGYIVRYRVQTTSGQAALNLLSQRNQLLGNALIR